MLKQIELLHLAPLFKQRETKEFRRIIILWTDSLYVLSEQRNKPLKLLHKLWRKFDMSLFFNDVKLGMQGGIQWLVMGHPP